MKVQLRKINNQSVIVDQCDVADSFLVRLVGLMGKARLSAQEGMFFPQCSSVHVWFMRFPIDVVFVRKGQKQGEFVVSSVRENVSPWKALPLMDWRASETFELPAGSVRQHGIAVGDQLCIG